MPPISASEANALRYAAGYVCRNLHKKLKSASHPHKNELILCLLGLVQDSRLSDSECEMGGEWMFMVYRYRRFVESF